MCNVTSISESPEEGFEPTTNGLTVHCSTAELFRNKKVDYLDQEDAILDNCLILYNTFSSLCGNLFNLSFGFICSRFRFFAAICSTLPLDNSYSLLPAGQWAAPHPQNYLTLEQINSKLRFLQKNGMKILSEYNSDNGTNEKGKAFAFPLTLY